MFRPVDVWKWIEHMSMYALTHHLYRPPPSVSVTNWRVVFALWELLMMRRREEDKEAGNISSLLPP